LKQDFKNQHERNSLPSFTISTCKSKLVKTLLNLLARSAAAAFVVVVVLVEVRATR